ncbi:MAG: M48 family metallopeptidase [Myxococcota bacterium]
MKQRFPRLSSRAFEHSLDRTALQALRRVKGFDWVVRMFMSAIGERRLRLFFLGSAVRVTESQYPKVHGLFREACEILDIDEMPELFISNDFATNAAAIGVDKPFVILTSSLVDMLDEDELQCVMGHELGHILCGHALYTTLMLLIVRMWYVFLGIPGGIYAAIAIRLALLEWSRKAEYSSDRAGLLVTQSLEVSQRVNMKLAGGRHADQMSVAEFEAQAKEYEAGGDLLDGVLKLMLIMNRTHPLPVLRVAELSKWVESGAYQKILDGEYSRRDDEAPDSWLDELKRTSESYREGFSETADPLLGVLRDLGKGAQATGADLLSFFRRRAEG